MISPQRLAAALCSITLVLISGAARAQVFSLYGTFAPVHVSNAVTVNTTGQPSADTTGSYWASGFGGGVTVSPLHLGPASLGLDIRASDSPQKKAAQTILVGLKLGAKLPGTSIKPYVEGAGGYLGANVTIASGPAPIAGSSSTRGYWAYEVLGGIDCGIAPHLDLRLIEAGGGQGSIRDNVTGFPKVSFLTISAGAVVHF